MPPSVSKQSRFQSARMPWNSVDAERPQKVDNPNLKFQRQAEIDICLKCEAYRCNGSCGHFTLEKENIARQAKSMPKHEKQPRPRREIDRATFEKAVRSGMSRRKLLAQFHIGKTTLHKLLTEWGLDKV